jgi:hypothetical protein
VVPGWPPVPPAGGQNRGSVDCCPYRGPPSHDTQPVPSRPICSKVPGEEGAFYLVWPWIRRPHCPNRFTLLSPPGGETAIQLAWPATQPPGHCPACQMPASPCLPHVRGKGAVKGLKTGADRPDYRLLGGGPSRVNRLAGQARPKKAAADGWIGLEPHQEPDQSPSVDRLARLQGACRAVSPLDPPPRYPTAPVWSS